MPADKLIERHRARVPPFSAVVNGLVPVLEEIALAAVSDLLPTAHRLEMLGVLNGDWAWTLRIQHVLDADHRVPFDVAVGADAAWRTARTRSASATSIYSGTASASATSERTRSSRDPEARTGRRSLPATAERSAAF